MDGYSVSVIVPVYNSDKYISETVESVCNQTYRDFEVILVDDESTDRSSDIALKLFEVNQIKCTVIRQKNKGLPGARNTGIRVAAGDYICFIDSDDVISPTHLFDLISTVKKFGVEVAYSMFEYTDESNRNGKRNEINRPSVIWKKEFLYNFVRRKPAVHCCSLMIKSALIKGNNLEFNEKLRKYGEDVEFMWRLFPAVDKIGCTGNYTYKYLVRNNSLMTVGRIEPWDVFLKEFAHSIKKERDKYPDLSRYYLWAYYRTHLGLLRIIAENSDYQVFLEYSKKLVTKEMKAAMGSFPDIKIRIMMELLRNSKKTYYALYRRRIRF